MTRPMQKTSPYRHQYAPDTARISNWRSPLRTTSLLGLGTALAALVAAPLMAGAQQRIDRAMNVAIGRETDSLMSGLTFLATVGSISPFVGLFGTVWGIKNSFQEIAAQQSTNLAVVAPGIAEALVATGLGLLAAIPAVIFYNKLSGDAERLAADNETFADEFSMILSRQLDREA